MKDREEKVNQIVELYEGGMSAPAIVKKLKLSLGFVRKALQENNVQMRTAKDY